MTTTASEWRHALESLVVKWCMAPGPRAGYCGCDTPTPGPTSPCAMCWKRKASPWHPEGADPWSHDFMAMKGEPTLCTCGHHLERVES